MLVQDIRLKGRNTITMLNNIELLKCHEKIELLLRHTIASVRKNYVSTQYNPESIHYII